MPPVIFGDISNGQSHLTPKALLVEFQPFISDGQITSFYCLGL